MCGSPCGRAAHEEPQRQAEALDDRLAAAYAAHHRYAVSLRCDVPDRREAANGGALTDLVAERVPLVEFLRHVGGDRLRPGASQLALRLGPGNRRRDPGL